MSRGGKRSGAGRPPESADGLRRVRLSVSVDREQMELLETIAQFRYEGNLSAATRVALDQAFYTWRLKVQEEEN